MFAVTVCRCTLLRFLLLIFDESNRPESGHSICSADQHISAGHFIVDNDVDDDDTNSWPSITIGFECFEMKKKLNKVNERRTGEKNMRTRKER